MPFGLRERTAGGVTVRSSIRGALVLVALLIGLAPAPAGADSREGDLRVTDLRTEHADNPLGIDQRRPRLSWVLGSSERGQEQSAYQVQVATSRSRLRADRPDVWDSSRVASPDSIGASYDGPPLESAARYHWRVRGWDADGQPSRWSDPAWWEMGLLEASDWRGKWIGRERPQDPSFGDFTLEVELTPVEAAFGVFFRARGTANNYMWQLIGIGNGAPLLRTHRWVGGRVQVLRNVPIGHVIPADEFFDRPHTLTIEATGDRIAASVDGTLVDTVTDSSHAAGGIGFRASTSDVTGRPEEGIVHRVKVTGADGVLFEDDFATDSGQWTGGTHTDEGLRLRGSSVSFLTASGRLAAPLLRRDFEIGRNVERARLYVSGLAYADVSLNGRPVGDHRLDPAFVDYGRRALYVTHAVTDRLRTGSNAIGAMPGRGFYGMTSPSVWDWHVAGWHDDPKLLLQLEIEHTDGTRTTIASDGSWQSATGPVLSDSLLSGERHDARREQPGWDRPGFDASAWDDAALADDPGVDLEAQMLEPIEATDELEPVALSEPTPGSYVFDVGQNIAGWVALTMRVPRGTDLVLRYGEKLHPDGTVNNDDVLNHVSEPYQTDRYIARGGGRETFESRFSYKGFQYVQVDGLPARPRRDDLEAKHVRTAVDDIGGFSSSNELFNQIDRGTRWAILNNLHGMPTDTPMFEKNGWTADGQLMVQASMHNFAMPRVYAKWLDDMRDGQVPNGRIPVIAPTHGWGNDWIAPEWSSTYVLLAWDHYRQYGDARVLAEHYDALRAYVDYELGRLNARGLSSSSLGDWAAPGYSQSPAPEDRALTSTAFVHRATALLSEIASVLGNGPDAAAYAERAERIERDFNAAFLDPAAGIYRTDRDPGYRQTSNALPLAWGLVPDEQRADVLANLVDDVVNARNGHLNTGAIGTKQLLRVLTAGGHVELAHTIATKTTYPSWGNWFVNGGATTPFEFWENDSRSRGHMFLGTILDWFYADLAGLRTERIGADGTLEVRPYPIDELDHAGAWTETPY